METVRILHWLDRGAGRIISGLRHSPAWYFVTLVGTLGVFLTILMFVSLIDETSGHRSKQGHLVSTANLGRHDLEKIHEWTVQDRWRVAHMFVLHKPARKPQDIQLDSRLMTSTSTFGHRATRAGTHRTSLSKRTPTEDNIDVRLELIRPKKAQQGNRTVAGTVHDLGSDLEQRPALQIGPRDPRLLVQATWEFGSDCNQYDYVTIPRRRLIPVPEPEFEPEPLREPIRRAMPDLSFEMSMIRHVITSGLFPSDSRVISKSDRSVFPDDDRRYSSELVSHDERRWKRFNSARDHSHSEAIPYIGAGVYDSLNDSNSASDEYDPTLGAVAEVALRVELSTPHVASAGETHRSLLLVTNEGQDSISRIEVRDDLSQLKTVVAADPEAMGETDIDPETGLRSRHLHREISGLSSGHENEFALKWFPEGHQRQVHRVRVIAHAAVSTNTEVNRPDSDQQMPSIPPESLPEKHPALACDIQHLERVYVGDDIELEIAVRNTGDTTLHRVKVQVEIPNQLSHRDGTTFVFDAGNLAVGGRKQTVLKMSALHAGEAVNSLHVETTEPVHAQGRAIILVVERSKEQHPLVPLPETIRVKPQPASRPLKLTPVPQSQVGECCCQRVPLIRYEPSYQLP